MSITGTGSLSNPAESVQEFARGHCPILLARISSLISSREYFGNAPDSANARIALKALGLRFPQQLPYIGRVGVYLCCQEKEFNMDEAKALMYHGMQSEEDTMPKVKYEEIPEDRREKWNSHLATFDGVVSNEQEFEEWLAVYVHVLWKDGDYEKYIGGAPKQYRDSKQHFEDMLKNALGYHRNEYRHITEFRKWRTNNLDPQIQKLADMAANAPQFDWQNLYALERQKILCMRTYFSHSRISDSTGNFKGRMWLDICLSLLEHIESDGSDIPYERIKKMNIRNVKGLVSPDVVNDYVSAKEPRKNSLCPDKEFYGRMIYVRKMERLYHLIRLCKTRDWWE